jgi:hypothetical protein
MKRAMARVAMAMVMAMRVVGNKEGDGNMASVMVMATRLLGKGRQR